MPMGSFKSSPTFVAIVTKIQYKLYVLDKERGLDHVGSKVFIKDILIHDRRDDQFLVYFWTVPDALKHTIKPILN